MPQHEQKLVKLEQPGAQINGLLSHAKFILKEANFLKKSGFY